MKRIVVTGAASLLGSRLLERLSQSGPAERLLGLDHRSVAAAGVRCLTLDLSENGVDAKLLELFRAEGVSAVVHLALRSDPGRDGDASHRLESQGTRALLAACAAAGVEHVVVRSFTALYGPRPDSDDPIEEGQPLLADSALGWARDKLEVEQHAVAFARRYPGMRVSVLRLAALLGAGVDSFYARLLASPMLAVPAGADPQLQLLHPDDAAEAIALCLEKRPRGPVNVAPASTVPLRRAIELCGRRVIDVPAGLLKLWLGASWSVGRGAFPAGFVDYLSHSWVADVRRARRSLGFEARYRSREALASWLAGLRSTPPPGRPRR